MTDIAQQFAEFAEAVPYWFIIPGIFNGDVLSGAGLDDPNNWYYQSQLWIYKRGLGLAAGFNYADGIVGATATMALQAAVVADDLRRASAVHSPAIIVAHSNGCRINGHIFNEYPNVKTKAVHWIAAAIDSNCDRNGLNAAAENGQVEAVNLYVSAKDEILGLGPWVSYGTLGKDGPDHVSPALNKILRVVHGECGHTEWVTKNFEQTMQAIAGAQV